MPTQPTPRRAAQRRPAGQPAFLNQRNVGFIFVALVLVALTIFFIRVNARASVPRVASADPANAAQVAAGQSIYTTRCASCHGAQLEGQAGWPTPQANGSVTAPPLDQRGPAWQRNDQALFLIVKAGGQQLHASGMPALGGGLSDEQIWAALAYIKSTWPAETRAAQPR